MKDRTGGLPVASLHDLAPAFSLVDGAAAILSFAMWRAAESCSSKLAFSCQYQACQGACKPCLEIIALWRWPVDVSVTRITTGLAISRADLRPSRISEPLTTR